MDKPPNSDNQPDETNALLMELMRRLVVQFYGYTGPPGRAVRVEPQLLAGQIPPGFPSEIALPKNSQIIGSVVHGSEATIVFDSALTPGIVEDFFDAQSISKGWRRPETSWPNSGFTASIAEEAMGRTFCLGEKGPSLHVQIYEGRNGLTDVRVTLSTDTRYSMCAQEPPVMPPFPRMREIIPTLKPPRGAQQVPGGGSGSDTYRDTSAILMTKLDMESVAAHYNRQLEAAGWTMTGEGQNSSLAWSTWDFEDDGRDWTGIYFVFAQTTHKDNYFLLVHAHRMPGDDETEGFWRGFGGTGWTSF